MRLTWHEISINWHHVSILRRESRPFVTPVSHLFVVVVAQTPSQNLLFQPSPAHIDFLCLSFTFCLRFFLFFLLALSHSAHRFTSKPGQLALDAFLRALRGPSSHPVPPLVPWSLCRQRARGAVVWKVEPQMDIDMSACVMWWGLARGSLDQPQLSVITPEGVEDFSFLSQEYTVERRQHISFSTTQWTVKEKMRVRNWVILYWFVLK